MKSLSSRWLSAYARGSKRWSGWILAGLGLITLVLALQLPRLQVVNDLQAFYPDHELTRTSQTVASLFGADRFGRTLYVQFTPVAGQSITSPLAVLEMEVALQRLRDVPGVSQAQGLPDLVKQTESGLHGGDRAHAVLPVDGNDLGLSFADVIQITMQRLSAVNDYVSHRGMALVVATIDPQAHLSVVAERAERALVPLIQEAEATTVALMSYGTAINTFNATTRSDLLLILPLAASLMALVLGWTFRLRKDAWLWLFALVAALSAMAPQGTLSHWGWLATTGLALVLFLAGLWRHLAQRGRGTRVKAALAATVGWGGLWFIVSGPAANAGLAACIIIIGFLHLREVLLPLAVVAAASIWTFGLMAVFEIPLNFLMIAILPLLLGVGLDDALHLMIRFRQAAARGEDGALSEGVIMTGRTLWFTTVSTMAGFAALSASGSPPVQAFGVLAALAMLSAFLVTMALIPNVQHALGFQGLSTTPIGPRAITVPQRMLRPRWAWGWLALVGVLGVAAMASAPSLKVFPYDLRWLLPPQDEQVALYEQLNQSFKNYDQVQILLEGDVATLPVMRALGQTLAPALSSSPYVRQVHHIGRLLDDVRFSDAEAEARFLEEFVSNPDRAYLNLLEHAWAQPNLQPRLQRLVRRSEAESYPATVVRVDVLRAHDPDGVAEITRDLATRVDAIRAELESLGLTVSLSGSPFLEALSLHALRQGFFSSLALALLLVGGVMVVLFRSILWSAVCLVPMALVVALELATIHWLGMRISASTALVAAIGIGLGVDYTIHLAQRFRETGDIIEAATAVSPALLATTGTSVAAFLTLMLGQIPWNRDFGLLASTAIVYALVVTLWVFPSLLAVMKPWLMRQNVS